MAVIGTRYLTSLVFLYGAHAAAAQPRPAVLELFTSQGCSSCPPADVYIGELSQRDDVLPLALHVDYWDELGWHDRFALTEAAPRQRVYAGTLHLSSIYTPQAVIDGNINRVGTDRAAIGKALATTRNGVKIDVSVRHDDIVIDLGGEDGAAPADVILLPYLRRAVSKIGRGENSGRTLTEFNIVRAMRRLGTWSGRPQQYHAALTSLPTDATDFAILVQGTGQGAVIGAATHRLR